MKTDKRLNAEIELCKLWINQFTAPTVNFRHDRSSYGYKHNVERYFHTYISNYAFKSATKELGVKFKPDDPMGINEIYKLRVIPKFIEPMSKEYNEPADILNLIISNKNK